MSTDQELRYSVVARAIESEHDHPAPQVRIVIECLDGPETDERDAWQLDRRLLEIATRPDSAALRTGLLEALSERYGAQAPEMAGRLRRASEVMAMRREALAARQERRRAVVPETVARGLLPGGILTVLGSIILDEGTWREAAMGCVLIGAAGVAGVSAWMTWGRQLQAESEAAALRALTSDLGKMG